MLEIIYAQLKVIEVAIIGLFALLGLTFGGVTIEPTEIELTEVSRVQTQVGERNAHVFLKDGKKFVVEITKEEYEALGLKGAGQPTYLNAEWLYSFGGQPIYETQTPLLKDNEYVLLPEFDGISTTTPTTLIKMPNEPEKIIDSNLIIDNKLTEEPK